MGMKLKSDIQVSSSENYSKFYFALSKLRSSMGLKLFITQYNKILGEVAIK